MEEFGSYAWDEKATQCGKDAPLKVNDHSMDQIRYYCMTINKNRLRSKKLNLGI